VKRFFAILLVVAAVAASYAPAVRNGFVWDDVALVLRDPLIRSWRLIPEGFNHYLFLDATPSDFYRPLQRLTYTVEYAFFAANPAPYHLTNIALHAAAAIALMLFAETLLAAFGYSSTRSRWIALTGALVWAIHPVHTSAVVYVSGRADLLATLFGFTGCYFMMRSLVRPKNSAFLLMALAAVAFLCSAFSKETGFVFPVFSAAIFVLLKQRRALISLGIVSLFVGLIYFSLRIPAEHNPPPSLGPEAPLTTRPITAARAVAEYAGLLVLPVNLHMERTVNEPVMQNGYGDTSRFAWRELQTLAGIIIATAFLVWVIRARRQDPAVFALLIGAIAAYLPISGVVRLNAAVAEHWIYVPSAFLLVAAAAVLAPIAIRLTQSPLLIRSSVAVLATWMLFLGGRTFVRTFDWRDQRIFLERTIAAGGNSTRMLINLASLESSENHLDTAKKHLLVALQRQPDQPFAIVELAAVYLKQRDFRNARELLGRAAKMELVAAQAHELMVILENKENGRTDLLRLRLAARTGCPNWAIEKRYIKLLAETGATAAAIRELQVCLQTQWYRAESWQLLADLLAKTGQSRGSADAMAVANSYDVHLAQRPAAL